MLVGLNHGWGIALGLCLRSNIDWWFEMKGQRDVECLGVDMFVVKWVRGCW